MGRDDKKIGAVLVVGGGIGGIQSSLDLAQSGFKVYLLESSPCLGGVMAQLDKTFPTNDCSMCILSPKLVECGRHLNVELITNAQLSEIGGRPGQFEVTIVRKPRYVDLSKCTGCGECVPNCPVEVPNEFDLGLSKRKAIYRLYDQAVPSAFAIDKREVPPCKIACPVHTSVQGYIALIAQGKLQEALDLIRRDNPFPAICSRVCTHPCESKCKRGEVDEPLAIRSLKRFVTDRAEPIPPEKPESKYDEKVAIIGAGPAGLTAAHDLAKLGYKVTIFESSPVLGGMLHVGIPKYRLPKDVLKKEIDYILSLGVVVKTNTTIGRDLRLSDLMKNGYKAVFLAIGAQKSQKLNIEGEGLKGVFPGLSFLRKVNLNEVKRVEGRVAVIGGGNTAIDAARSALRLGASEVFIVYRRTKDEMPAIPSEVKEAEREGVKLIFLASPIRILGENGTVKSVECIRMKLGEPDESGRRRPIPIKGSEFILRVDILIPAIGQIPDLSPFADVGIAEGRKLTVDPDTLATSHPAIFAGGDVVTGPASVIDAIAAGKKAAVSIHGYLRGEVLKKKPKEAKVEVGQVPTKIEPKKRQRMPGLSIAERKGNFDEIELGFDREMALEEASRCLNCGPCSECFECEKVCQAKAINHQDEERVEKLSVGAVILAPGFDEFDAAVKSEYGYGRYPNVVTSIEFERILSASGPYRGRILRPSDGAIPKKIAFIQCVGSRDETCGNNYCSSVCCMYAIKEAIIAKEHEKTIEPTIFFMDIRAYGKDFEKYYNRGLSEGVRFIRSRVSSVEEAPETRNLRIKYEAEDGAVIQEEFDLVVLSVGFEPRSNILDLAQRMGLKLNKYGFCETPEFSPVETSRHGIFVCGAFQGPKDIPETVMQASGAASRVAGLLSPVRGSLTRERVFPPEIDVRGKSPRIGVFICHCGINIGGVVNVPDVTEYVRTLSNVVYVEYNLYTCSQDTQLRIKELIKEHNLNRIVVASCSPRTHEPLFQGTIREAGLNRYLFEMANIRDQCSWVHMHEPEKATQKAKDLVRMAVAKARLLQPLRRLELPVTPKGLVIGGGLSGMTAALSLAEQGFEVYLVERERELGGNLRRIYYTLDGEDVQEYLNGIIEKVKANPLINVYTNARIKEVAGYVGNFKTTVIADGVERELEHGIVIVATGGREYQPEEYLYGKDARVITQRELEEKIAQGDDAVLNSNTIVMIQCIGSRERERSYCSRICCTEAVKNALKMKEKNLKANIFILYRDLRTYGFREDYYRKAREAGIIFIRFDEDKKPKVAKGKEALEVLVRDPILGEEILLRPDLLVLSVGIVPQPDNEELAKMLKVPLNEDEFYLEAHMKLRPVDFATDGIFLCGLAHSPKFMEESVSQAYAAASRASTILAKDKIELEGTIATVNEFRCTGCGMCISVCAYNALELDEEKKVARVNEVLCKGCGACSATCRCGAIDVLGVSNEQILSLVDAL